MKKNNPGGGPGCGSSGIDERFGRRIIPLIRPRPNRPGILTYRQQRSHAEFCRVIRDALDREARLARVTGVHTSPQVLEDITAWIERGAIPI